MSLESVSVVRRWFEEVWNQRREQTITELLKQESVCYGEQGPLWGPEGFKQQIYTPFVAAFPDIRVTVEAVIAEGDQVVVRWTAAGTHTGGGVGHPPTGREVSFRGMTWLRVGEGKMIEGWQSSNIPEVLRSLAPA
jgi:predicted ester cyclase